MGDEDFAGTIVAAAMEQYNARLRAVADGRGALVDGQAVYVEGGGTLPLLTSGLDIDGDALTEVCHALAHDVLGELAREQAATGAVGCSTLQTALEAMWVAGCLHERERARRDEAGA